MFSSSFSQPLQRSASSASIASSASAYHRRHSSAGSSSHAAYKRRINLYSKLVALALAVVLLLQLYTLWTHAFDEQLQALPLAGPLEQRTATMQQPLPTASTHVVEAQQTNSAPGPLTAVPYYGPATTTTPATPPASTAAAGAMRACLQHATLTDVFLDSSCTRLYDLSAQIPSRVYRATHMHSMTNPALAVDPNSADGYIAVGNILRYSIDFTLTSSAAYYAEEPDWSQPNAQYYAWQRMLMFKTDASFTIDPTTFNALDLHRAGIDPRLLTLHNISYVIAANGKPEAMHLRNVYDHTLNAYTSYLPYAEQQRYHNVQLRGYQDGERNKNYMPLLHNDTLLVVHSFSPVVMLQCQLQDGRCAVAELIKEVRHLPGVEQWHGGTPFIPLPQFSSSISYIGLVHERQPYWMYKHRFVVMSLGAATGEWHVTHYSDLFHLDHPTATRDFYVEFAVGLIYEQRPTSPHFGQFVVSYGKNDTLAMVKIIDSDYVLHHLVEASVT